MDAPVGGLPLPGIGQISIAEARLDVGVGLQLCVV
jgi:hypothetical protein